jgi:acetylornithine deacetylase/succinyl-diaminopimelate desuccinylase-like protein
MRRAWCFAAMVAAFGLLAGAPAPTLAGPIDLLVEAVSTDTLDARVDFLSSYPTRRADQPEARQAAAWLAARLRDAGTDTVALQLWSHGYAPNVVARRRGTTRPRELVVVGGHFDSISRQGNEAPGADDNASGTACVLECARVLCTMRFERSIEFVAFSAEEVGLFGSNAYVAHLAQSGDSLVAMLNVDMIGYRLGSDRRDSRCDHRRLERLAARCGVRRGRSARSRPATRRRELFQRCDQRPGDLLERRLACHLVLRGLGQQHPLHPHSRRSHRAELQRSACSPCSRRESPWRSWRRSRRP